MFLLALAIGLAALFMGGALVAVGIIFSMAAVFLSFFAVAIACYLGSVAGAAMMFASSSIGLGDPGQFGAGLILFMLTIVPSISITVYLYKNHHLGSRSG